MAKVNIDVALESTAQQILTRLNNSNTSLGSAIKNIQHIFIEEQEVLLRESYTDIVLDTPVVKEKTFVNAQAWGNLINPESSTTLVTTEPLAYLVDNNTLRVYINCIYNDFVGIKNFYIQLIEFN